MIYAKDLLSYLLVKEGVLSPGGMPALLMPSGDVRIFSGPRGSTILEDILNILIIISISIVYLISVKVKY